MYSSQGLNDDMWHILRFSRRATKIKLQIDDDPVLKGKLYNNYLVKINLFYILNLFIFIF